MFTIDRPGAHTVKWIAVDIKGNVSPVQAQTFLIGPDTTVSGTVPATLSLTLGTPASLGTFTPGVNRDYETSMTANVISTGGDALLSVSDGSSTAPGRLVNDRFSLAQPLQVRASSLAGGPGFGYAPLPASASTPLPLLAYTGPTSNDAVTVGFRQPIGANEGLRTGTYSKTLTFTLSTASP